MGLSVWIGEGGAKDLECDAVAGDGVLDGAEWSGGV